MSTVTPIRSLCRHRLGGWCSVCVKMVPRPKSSDIKISLNCSTINNRMAISMLARTLPALDKFEIFDKRIDKVDGRTIKALFHDAYATSEYLCLQFILSVWLGSNAHTVKAYRFDLVHALGTLDENHRRAIAAWVENPWWP